MAPRPQNQQPSNTAPPVTIPGTVLPPPTGGAVSSDISTGVSSGYIPPNSNYSGIKDEQGNQLPFYNLNSGPRELLTTMQDEVTRNVFLKNLYERGWYKSGRPGGGLSDDDRDAVYRLMYFSNLTGTTWNQVYSLGKKSPFAEAQSADGRFRVAATEDLVEIANRTALSTIGRKLSAEEASKFSRAYQATQQAEASGGAAAPDTNVFFKNRIEKQYGAESDGYKYLSAISNVAKLMENM
jgi:hypothetical protein